MNVSTSFDVIVVGAGPGGIFTTLELVRKNPNKKVLVIERGKPIEKRMCPAQNKEKCMHCHPCNIMCGMAGAGAFSDGKLHWYPEELMDIPVGGNLHKYIGVDLCKKYAAAAHEYYLEFGATKQIEGMKNPAAISEIKNRIESVAGLSMPIVPVRHIGTEKSRDVFQKIENYLMNLENVTMMFETEVEKMIVKENVVKGVVTTTGQEFSADNVVLAVGRSGSTEFVHLANKYGIDTAPGTIDIGVRVEIPREVLAKECKDLYELKIIAKTPTYKDECRTFCMNDGGFVTSEMTNGIVCANGHANKEKKSQTTNFAILVSINFNDIKEPMEYMESIGKTLNILGHGNVLVQRLGDVRKGKRTWKSELVDNAVMPTLKAVEAGDITLGFPARIIKDIVEMLDMMEPVLPGIADDSILLYGPEMKFYGIRPKYRHVDRLETNIKGLHVIGDGCGLTRGLIQASASGVLVGRYLAKI